MFSGISQVAKSAYKFVIRKVTFFAGCNGGKVKEFHTGMHRLLVLVKSFNGCDDAFENWLRDCKNEVAKHTIQNKIYFTTFLNLLHL